MSSISKEANGYFNNGCNCAQSVLSALAEELGMDRNTVMNIAFGFGGGMARTGETCGAVTAGIMAMGLAHGSGSVAEQEKKEAFYALVRDFLTTVKEQHGSTLCRELIGFDVSIPEERQKAKELGRFDVVCPKMVHDVTVLVEERLPKNT